MPELGKIERIDDLRTVWKNEARDFTGWLAEEENLDLLSEAVGIDLDLEERESAVGSFSVDLFASEEGTGRKVIPVITIGRHKEEFIQMAKRELGIA